MVGLLDKLPPFKGNEVVLVDEQDVDDIITGIVKRHKIFAPDYDCIAADFLGGDEYDISKRLFDYVKRSIPYEVESRKKQTVRSPSAILAMSGFWGGDCKHYASFIAGVLDAIERLTGTPIDWVYRFAGYNILDPDDLGHVFVVINPGSDDEIWIDPVLDEFNSRNPWPWYREDVRPKNNMSLVQVSGVPNRIQSAIIAPRERNACSLTGSGGCGIGDAPTTTAALDSVQPGLGQAVNQAMSTLPEGDVKDFLQGLLDNPQKALTQLIFGRTYTSGDYQLAEYFMRNILGMTNIQRWEQVPDTYVPQAWAFFTTAMGVRMRTSQDMDALCGFASTRQERAKNYLTRNPEQTPDIAMAAAVRVAYLMGEPGYDGLFSIYKNRDNKWAMSAFGPNVPYVYPIPGVLQNGPLFSGVHPVTGQTFVNGYPVDYTGPRYISQVSQVIQNPADYTQPGTTTPGTTTPGITTPGGDTKASLVDIASANPWTTALLIGGGLYAVLSIGTKKQGRRSRVSGISKNQKKVLVIGGAGALALYLLTRKKDTQDDITVLPPATSVPGAIAPLTPGPETVTIPVPANPTITPGTLPGANTSFPTLQVYPSFVDAPIDTVLTLFPDDPTVYMYPDYTPVTGSEGGGGGGGTLVDEKDNYALNYAREVQQFT